MASGAKVEVLGYAELASGNATLAKRIGEAAPDEFRRAADDVAATVQARVPKRTGALAGSVTTDVTEGAALVGMGAGIPYAGFVEFGGRGHPASPEGNYLYPTALEATPVIVAAAERVAENEIGGMTWPRPG